MRVGGGGHEAGRLTAVDGSTSNILSIEMNTIHRRFLPFRPTHSHVQSSCCHAPCGTSVQEETLFSPYPSAKRRTLVQRSMVHTHKASSTDDDIGTTFPTTPNFLFFLILEPTSLYSHKYR